MIELEIIPDSMIVAEEWKMKKLEWWTMYFETQRLKHLGLMISQIARALSLSRNTVYRYLEMNPEDLDQERERRKKLDIHTDEIVAWLKKYPDLSAAQIEDWLEEKNGKKVEACNLWIFRICGSAPKYSFHELYTKYLLNLIMENILKGYEEWKARGSRLKAGGFTQLNIMESNSSRRPIGTKGAYWTF